MPLTKVTPNNLHTTVQNMVTTMVNENAVDSADVVTLINANAIDSADATLIINSNIAAKSTSDLSEGSNLYYTTARFDSDFSTGGTFTDEVIFQGTSYRTDWLSVGHWNFRDGVEARFGNSDDLRIYHNGSSNLFKGTSPIYLNSNYLYMANASNTNTTLSSENGVLKLKYQSNNKLETTNTGIDVTGSITLSGTLNNHTIPSGSGTFAITSDLYQDSDVGAYIAGNRTYGNITTTGYIAGPATMTIDPAAVGDNTGTVVIAGNLQVDGTTTTINSTTVTIDDKTLILGDGSTTDSQANGTAVVFGGQSNAASIYYTSATDTIGFGNIAGIDVTGTAKSTAVTTTNSGITLQSNSVTKSSINVAATTNQGINGTAAGDQYNWTNGGKMLWSTNNGTNAHLVLDASGNVGIGCTPDQKLHVKGTIEAQATNSTNGWQLYTYTDNSFRVNFNGAGADEFQINSDGNAIFLKNLSIGDSTLSTYHIDYPAVELGASGSVQGYTGNNGAWLQSNLFMNTNGHWTSKSDDYSAMIELYDGNINFYNTASGTGTRTLLTPMTIRQNGNVGIGVTNADCALDIRQSSTGNLLSRVWNNNTSGTGSATVRVANSGNNAQGSRLEMSDHAYYVATITGDQTNGMQFYAGQMANPTANLRMTLDINGRLGIGTDSPGEKLEVNGVIQIKRDSDHPAMRFVEINSGTSTTRGYIASGDWAVNGGAIDDFGISGSVTGDLLFATNAGTERLRIQNSTGNVGIGTDSPDAKLQVGGNVKVGSASHSSWTDSVDDIGGLDVFVGSGSHAFTVWDDNSQSNARFIVERAGNVGIGTTNPGEKLDVNGVVRSIGNNDPNYSISVVGRYDSTHPAAVYVRGNSNTNSEIIGVFADSGGANLRTVINPSNNWNVGIGTQSPSQKLEVAGNINADGYYGDGGATSNITFSQATSTSNPSVALWGRDHGSYPGQVHIVGRNSNSNTSSGDIRFWNYNGSTWYNMFRFAYDDDNSDIRTTLQTITDTNTAIVSNQSIYNIIDSNNNQSDRAFFVSCNSDRPGNATTIIKAGEDRNIVFGQNSGGGMYNGTGSNGFGVLQAGLGGQYVVVQNTGDSNLYLSKHSSFSDGRYVQFSIAGNTKGSITSSTGNTGVNYNTTSDLRLKTDIKPIDDATDKLLSMNPVRHKWKAQPDQDAVHGFIAQEMQEIVPEAVTGDPDGDEMMSMDYGRITPVVVAALQDALKEINDLKRRIKELEDK